VTTRRRISAKKRLRAITEQLLDHDSDPGQLREACIRLHDVFAELSNVGGESTGADVEHETRLATGVALSPRDAARCALDSRRTVMFIRGIHSAIQRSIERSPDQPIHLLYAGCGPYATLALPLAMCVPPEQLQLTLIDIHEGSIEAVQRIILGLQLHDWVRECLVCDATTYVHPPGSPLHILVIEAMQKALEKEPQVALTLNLARQLSANGTLIPEEVRLDACLADLSREFALFPADHEGRPPSEKTRRRIDLGTILDLTSRTEMSELQPATFTAPARIDSCNRLMIRTRIRVFEGIVLDDYDSGITYPTVVHDVGVVEPGDRFQLSYELGSNPGVRTSSARA